jgi:hypothetical protein
MRASSRRDAAAVRIVRTVFRSNTVRATIAWSSCGGSHAASALPTAVQWIGRAALAS